jgi:hypothetical protein
VQGPKCLSLGEAVIAQRCARDEQSKHPISHSISGVQHALTPAAVTKTMKNQALCCSFFPGGVTELAGFHVAFGLMVL